MIESMTVDGRVRRSLVDAAIAACAAPSVYNAQPWRLVLHPARLELYADRERMIYLRDPVGRQLHLSCGCALFNAMVSIAAAGASPAVRLVPSGDQADLVAEIATGSPETACRIGALRPWIQLRQTPRTEFASDGVDPETAECMTAAAAAQDAALTPVADGHHRSAVAALHEIAVAGVRQRVPDTVRREPGTADPADGVGEGAGLFVLSTASDDRRAWLAAGCALQRVLLELAARDLAGVPLMDVVECTVTRTRLASLLPDVGYPQILLRTGRAPRQAAVRRRRLVDVLVHGADWEG